MTTPIPDAVDGCPLWGALCPVDIVTDPATGEELQFSPAFWHEVDCIFGATPEPECPF